MLVENDGCDFLPLDFYLKMNIPCGYLPKFSKTSFDQRRFLSKFKCDFLLLTLGKCQSPAAKSQPSR